MALSSRPNFSGLWHCDLEHSIFRGEQPARIVAKIEHTGAQLTLEMQVTYGDGRESALKFHIDTDGKETTNGAVRSKSQWVGNELLIESWMAARDHALHFKDYWSLSADGATLTMAHRGDHLDGQTSILRRQTA
jgi:hypothetical protein